MATYKQPCRHCGALLSGDAKFCSKCGSRSPFYDLCPECLHLITRDETNCSGCGINLYISCPKCKQSTFIGDKCDKCGESLLKQCNNRLCGEMQFFSNKKCTACGRAF